MRTIYKYKIPVGGGKVNVAHGAKILSVGAQGEALFLWAEVDTERAEYPRQIEVFGTGHEIHYGKGLASNAGGQQPAVAGTLDRPCSAGGDA